ncbi:hypothetical protein B566_EDAN008699 [Ephemera danica]|nr:hypothetical protein B566_EDAN008699 [Ephemera danica]
MIILTTHSLISHTIYAYVYLKLLCYALYVVLLVTCCHLQKKNKWACDQNRNEAGFFTHRKNVEKFMDVCKYFIIDFKTKMVRISSSTIYNALNYSVAWNHMNQLFGGFYWVFTSLRDKNSPKWTVLNHLVAFALDSLLGVLLLHWLLGMTSPSELVDVVTNAANEGVVKLRDLLSFLMGSPGGLKLNRHFSIALGRFFQYNTNLWWVFLDQCRPLLVLACHAIEWIGLFGITTHLAILSDLLCLASFHAYCIYVYAARLYSLQKRGLEALWRLFLGRKWNPLRQCVDSCNYQPSQLFAGILSFTVLLFLLPTTAVYYGVFVSLRILFLAIEGLLLRLRFLVRSFPIVAITLWLFRYREICTNVSMHLLPTKTPGDPLELKMRPERASLATVLQLAMEPVPIHKPPSIEWMQYAKNILKGTLF